jgi:uncharacterized protein YkvS
MNNVQTAINAIRNMSNDEINQVVEAIKLQRTFNSRQMTKQLMVGDIVSFDGRGGATVTGRVTKINRKTVLVKDSASNTVWRVTASLLTPMSIGA